ncbi:hypothetical protein D3C85_1745140 [compost metagenome]
MFECSMDFLVHDLVGFTEISTALGMTNNNIIHAKLFQHSSADLASEGSFIFEMKILGANLD